MRFLAVACLMALAQPCLAEPPKPEDQISLKAIYDAAKVDCATYDNGVFSPGDAPVAEADLTGDDKPEQIVDFASFRCSSLAAYYGGTGGAPLVVLVDGKRWVWTAMQYEILKEEYSPPVLLMMEHGLECGGTGSDACYEAVVWNGETFMSVRNRE